MKRLTEEQERKRLRIIGLVVILIGVGCIFIPVFPVWLKIISPIIGVMIGLALEIWSFMVVQ